MEAWIEKLNKNMTAAFFDAFNGGDTAESVTAGVKFSDGSSLEVELYRNNNLEVYLYHADRENERPCPNITQRIEDNLIGWDELKEQYDNALPEDEWTGNGFRSETDYWNCRLQNINEL